VVRKERKERRVVKRSLVQRKNLERQQRLVIRKRRRSNFQKKNTFRLKLNILYNLIKNTFGFNIKLFIKN